MCKLLLQVRFLQIVLPIKLFTNCYSASFFAISSDSISSDFKFCIQYFLLPIMQIVFLRQGGRGDQSDQVGLDSQGGRSGQTK